MHLQSIVDDFIQRSMMNKDIPMPTDFSPDCSRDRRLISDELKEDVLSDDEEGIDEHNSSVSSGKVSSKSSKKRRLADMSEEERKIQRRAANRKSAFESRLRKKILIEDLQQSVQNLSKENAEIRREASSLRQQMETLLQENRQLRLQQQFQSTSRLTSTQDLYQQSIGNQLSTLSNQSAAAALEQRIGNMGLPPAGRNNAGLFGLHSLHGLNAATNQNMLAGLNDLSSASVDQLSSSMNQQQQQQTGTGARGLGVGGMVMMGNNNNNNNNSSMNVTAATLAASMISNNPTRTGQGNSDSIDGASRMARINSGATAQGGLLLTEQTRDYLRELNKRNYGS